MDASKALQALTDGDVTELVLSLDMDRKVTATAAPGMDNPSGGTNIMEAFGRIGRVFIESTTAFNAEPFSDREHPDREVCPHAELSIHVYDSEDEADARVEATIGRRQQHRVTMFLSGLPVPTLTVDGVVTPLPSEMIDFANGVVEQLRERLNLSITIPDNVSSLTV